MGRPAHRDRRQRPLLDVGVITQHAGRDDQERLVFERGVVVGQRERRVVGGVDRDPDRRDARVGCAVVDFVSEAVAAIDIRGRRVAEAAVRAEGQRAIGGTTHQDGCQRASVDVGVVGQHPGDGEGQRRVLIGAVAVVGGDRRVVHRGDGDHDRRHGGLRRAVARPVGEAVAPVEIGSRGVAEAAVGVQGQGTVGRPARQHRRQRCTVEVRIVAQYAGGGDRQGRVFVGAVAVVGRERRVVDTGDREADHGARGAAVAVANRVSERVGAVVVGPRRIENRPVEVDRRRAVRGHTDRRQR